MIARHPRLLLVVLCAAFALLQLWAFHWGVITPDSVVQYGQALSGRYDDWHPPVTAWLWRQLPHLGPGGAPFLLLDILLYWAAIGLIADGLRTRHGWPAAALPILIALLPVAFGQIGAILKDTLMACLLLLAASLLARRSWGGPGLAGAGRTAADPDRGRDPLQRAVRGPAPAAARRPATLDRPPAPLCSDCYRRGAAARRRYRGDQRGDAAAPSFASALFADQFRSRRHRRAGRAELVSRHDGRTGKGAYRALL
jgi:hypothetical protein